MSDPARPQLVVVGDVMVDVCVDSGPLARGGDVHGDVRLRPGGSGANTAVWAAAFGAAVRLFGRVGADLSGRLLREALQERGVDAALVEDRTAPTGAMLVVRERGDRSMVAARGANACLEPGDLPPVLAAGAILVSGYLLLHGSSEPAARAALDRAVGEVVAVDAASWPLVEAFGADRFLEATAKATLLFANEREAEAITSLPATAAAEALGRRYGMACVKLGERGALLSTGGPPLHSPAPPSEELDPTGAGDAFDGTFLAAVASGWPPSDALEAACRAGARAAASFESWPEP
jgi:sugar/nucleoside kinase (ribokinase family)